MHTAQKARLCAEIDDAAETIATMRCELATATAAARNARIAERIRDAASALQFAIMTKPGIEEDTRSELVTLISETCFRAADEIQGCVR